MKNLLSQMTAPIRDEFVTFQNYYTENLLTDVKLINSVVRYIVKRKGKQFRSRLCILSSKICGDVNENTYKAASLIEMIHVATLIHDDVVDDANKRRGWPSVNRIWKNKISLLIGDYMFSQVLQGIISIKNNDALIILSKTAKRLSQGEILQIEKSISKNMTEKIYLQMISDKTASLISASCKLGALSVTDDINKINTLSEFGEKLGIAFQIKDDLFDILGNIDGLGKPAGFDIKKNMLTLPLIHILGRMNHTQKKYFKIKLKINSSSGNLKENVKIIESLGGIEYAINYINKISNEAINLLDSFPSSEYKNALISLIDYNKKRNK